MPFSFKCPKCNGDEYELGELRGSSGGLSAYFDVDSAIYTAVSCRNCGFTEFFRRSLKHFAKIHKINPRTPPR